MGLLVALPGHTTDAPVDRVAAARPIAPTVGSRRDPGALRAVPGARVPR